METTAKPNKSSVMRRSARLAKLKQPIHQDIKQQTDEVNSQEDTEKDDQVDDGSSRPVKRTRMDSTQPNNAIGEEIVTECTTNPIQPNRHLQCSHCHKSFVSKAKLQTHLRVHTGERPFQCHQCDKRFTRKDHLDTHLQMHSGERPFACRHCEMSFTQLITRNKHEQAIHLHVKPYRCKQCGHTATLRSQIIRHIRVIHLGLPQTIKQQQAINIIDDRDPKELMDKV